MLARRSEFGKVYLSMGTHPILVEGEGRFLTFCDSIERPESATKFRILQTFWSRTLVPKKSKSLTKMVKDRRNIARRTAERTGTRKSSVAFLFSQRTRSFE